MKRKRERDDIELFFFFFFLRFRNARLCCFCSSFSHDGRLYRDARRARHGMDRNRTWRRSETVVEKKEKKKFLFSFFFSFPCFGTTTTTTTKPKKCFFRARLRSRRAAPNQKTTPPDTTKLTEDGRGVDGGGGSDAAVGRGAELEVAVDAADGEGQSSAGGARDGLLLVARGALAGAEGALRVVAEFGEKRRGGKGVNGGSKEGTSLSIFPFFSSWSVFFSLVLLLFFPCALPWRPCPRVPFRRGLWLLCQT